MAKGHFPPKVDAKTGLESADIYIAGRFGGFIRDPRSWSSTLAVSVIQPGPRAEAERIVAAHPQPDPAEFERARVALAPVLDARGNLRSNPKAALGDLFSAAFTWMAVSGVFIWAAFFSVMAAVLFRGGLLMRAFGIAAVRRDGADASRLRMLWRACVAWAWLPVFIVCISLEPASIRPVVAWIVGPVVLGLVVWSAVRRGRSLQDLLAGTWLVPR